MRLQIECQDYKDHLWFEVMDLPQQFNILLGQNWMAEYDCIMKTRDRACELTKRGRKHTLKLGIKMDDKHQKEVKSKDSSSPMIVSALQM